MERTLKDHGEIRVVITPTLSDIQEERNYLMGQVFPHLVQLAEEREVSVEFKWNAPFGIEGVHEYQVSLYVAENPHPYVFTRVTDGSANKERHFVEGVPAYDYEKPEELGRLIEKAFLRLLDRLYPHTTETELVKALRKVARIYQEFGQLEDSLEMHTRALNLLNKDGVEPTVDTCEQLYTCGWLNYKIGRTQEALDLLNKAVSVARTVYGEYDQHVTDFIGVLRMVEASVKRQ